MLFAKTSATSLAITPTFQVTFVDHRESVVELKVRQVVLLSCDVDVGNESMFANSKVIIAFQFRPAISSDVANIGRGRGRGRSLKNLVQFTGPASWIANVHADIRQTKRQQIQLDLDGYKQCSNGRLSSTC